MLHNLILIPEWKHLPHKERSPRPRLLYPVHCPRTKDKDLGLQTSGCAGVLVKPIPSSVHSWGREGSSDLR